MFFGVFWGGLFWGVLGVFGVLEVLGVFGVFEGFRRAQKGPKKRPFLRKVDNFSPKITEK